MARLNNMSAIDALAAYLDTLRDLQYTPEEVKAALLYFVGPASPRVTAAPLEGVSVPPGWKLVPLEPTAEMLNANGVDSGEKTARKTYCAMVAAAPPPLSPSDTGNVGAELNWREVAVWWEQGAKDWQDLKEIIPRMFNRAALPPPGRGMVPMTEQQIEAGASALVESCIAKGHWAHASDESKTIYRGHAKAVILAAHGIKEGS